MASDKRLIRALRKELRAAAEPEKAPQMQAYMKSSMPYYGVQTTPRRAVCKRVFARHVLADETDFEDTVLELWSTARYREERSAVLDLIRSKRYEHFNTLERLPLYERLVQEGAWWDLVDNLVPYVLAPLLDRHPDVVTKRVLAWTRSADLWLRRSAVIAQLKRKRATDVELLTRCIEAAQDSDEFFLRKAIGWALREYAKSDPEWVVRFVLQRKATLATLSKREALRNLIKDGWLDAVP